MNADAAEPPTTASGNLLEQILAQRVRAICTGWPQIDFKPPITLRLSPRLTRHLGHADAIRNTIFLAAGLRDHPALLDQALCHELAHLVAFNLVGKAEPAHGPTWQRLMRQAGCEPIVRLPAPPAMSAPRAAKAPTRYRHTCPICHFTRFAARRMTVWRCADCVAAGLDGVLHAEPQKVSR